jgi:2-polyprenyl-6-methoxyphenol hydroxylase-like FAD-dependent oxidoreductase
VEIIGAGPAGLCAAILLKNLSPRIEVCVTEQNTANATFGFGVVFSDQALDFLQSDDPQTHALITPQMERWRDIRLSLHGEMITLDGIGFSAIGRLRLLELLQSRAREVGVEMRFGQRLDSLHDIEAAADLIVGADGLNSLLRRSHEASFSPALDYLGNHFAWFGTTRAFDALTQTFIRGPYGELNAHHYRYAPGLSTFIVECDDASFEAHGFARMDEKRSAEKCRELFADTLAGAPLLTNRSTWRQFPRLWCDSWTNGKRVLLGDAAHSAHFSIGSGTRLALEDAIALVNALAHENDLPSALALFQQQRMPVARKLFDAANASARWYDDFGSRMALHPLEFAFSYLTRSGRVDRQRLRGLCPGFMARYEHYLEGAPVRD